MKWLNDMIKEAYISIGCMFLVGVIIIIILFILNWNNAYVPLY